MRSLKGKDWTGIDHQIGHHVKHAAWRSQLLNLGETLILDAICERRIGDIELCLPVMDNKTLLNVDC